MSNKKWEEQIFAHENEYEFSIRWIISWLGEHKAQGKKDIIKLITSLIDQKLTEQREEIVREVEKIEDEITGFAVYHKYDGKRYIEIEEEQLKKQIEKVIHLIKEK
jgi:phenylpyruvate tautomerase PptA (4-oxalocrotonate tautomerase family)